MKRFFALAALVLGLASCQTEPEGLDVNVGGAVDTVITVNIPENETRANNSGIGVFENGILESDDYTMRYIFQVYYRAENGTVTKSTERQVKYTDGTSVSFPVRLIPGRDYQFVVWADVVTSEDDTDNHYNTANLKAVSVIENSWNAMDETRDAFTASYAADDFNGSQSININLYRPFAKLRVIATDYDELAKIGIKVKKAAVNYTTVHRSTFNAYDSMAVETDVASIDKDHSTYEIATYTIETGDEHTIFSDYFFAENDVVKFEITVYDQNDAEIVTRALTTDIYAKRNYLTTIKGDILTDGNNVNVEVKPGFDKPDVEVDGDIKDELSEAAKNKHYVIDLEGDFIWETGAGHGSNPLIPADAITETLTINGNGYKFIATGTGVGAIRLANGGKLILNDLTVVDQSEYHAENGEVAWEFTYLEFAGETEFNDCVIDNTISLDGTKAVFNNCTFNDKETWPANVGQEYAAWVSNGEVEFNGCEFSGSRGIKVHEAYGSEVAEVVVDNCQFKNLSKKPGMAIGTLNADTKIEIKNSTFTNCQPGDQDLYMYETDTDVTTFTFVNENNTVNATVATSEAFAKVLKADIHTLNIALEGDVNVDVAANSTDYYFGGNNTNTITIDGAKVSTAAAATGADNNAYKLTFNHTNGDWNYIRLNNDNAKWVIKNVKLSNTGKNNGPWNRHDIRFYNDVVLKNVTSDKAIALLADADLTNVVISDVHPNNSEAYALWITAQGQTVNIKDCALLAHESKTTDRGIKIDNQYVNEGEAKVTLNVDGLKVKSQKKAAIVVNSKAGADITLQNVDLSEVAADTNNAVWVDSNAKQYAGLVSVTGASMVVEGVEPIEGDTADARQAAFNTAAATENAIVQLPAGEFAMPSEIANGVTIIGAEGAQINAPEGKTVSVTADNVTISNVDFVGNFNGQEKVAVLSLSGKNPTIANCTFTGAAGNGYGITVNGQGADDVITIKNCDFSQDDFFKPIFDNWNGLNGATLVIDGCTLANGLYTMHIDGGNESGKVIVKNSTLDGFTTNGASLDELVFENCVFGEEAGYACANLYTAHSFINCTFPTKADANNVSNYGLYVASTAKGDTLVFDGCKMSDGTQLDFSNIAVANGGFLHWDSDTENCKVIVNGTVFAANQEALKAALDAGDTDILLKGGNYELSGLNFVANNVTLKGVDKANVVLNLENSIYLQNKSVTLENLTYNLNAGKGYTEQAFAYVHHATAFNLKNCNVNRLRLNVYKANIEGCTFTLDTSSGFDGYCIYYYGKSGSKVVVNNSTFNTVSKGIVMYNEGAVVYDLEVNDCTFVASETDDKAAIQMHTEYGISGKLAINRSTATGFANVNNGLWNELNNNTKVATDKFDIWVDGTQVH